MIKTFILNLGCSNSKVYVNALKFKRLQNWNIIGPKYLRQRIFNLVKCSFLCLHRVQGRKRERTIFTRSLPGAIGKPKDSLWDMKPTTAVNISCCLVIIFWWEHLNFLTEGSKKWNKRQRVGVDSGRHKRSKGKEEDQEAEGTWAESIEIKVRISQQDSRTWELGVSKAAGRGISRGEEVAEGRRG